MGTIQNLIQDYTAFATEDGTVHDNGTIVLLGGALLILVLSVYAAYNVAAAVFSGVRRSVLGTVHGVVNIGRAMGRKPEVAVATASIPATRLVPVAAVGTGRPIARRREVAEIR